MPTQDTGVYGRSDTLPPIGPIQPGSDDEGKAVELIYARRQGIINALSLPLQLAKKCRRIAAWGEDTDRPDETQTVVHKIRQAVETQVSNHLKEPAKTTINPVETGEYAKWYWAGPPEAAIDAQGIGVPLDPIYLGAVTPMGEVIPPTPLPAALVMQLKQLADLYPDIVSPDYLCKMDDQYTAKMLQKKFDSDWKDAKGDKWLRSRVYANVVEGWQLPFYEYDPKIGHILNRNSIAQTYIDQSAEDIDDATEGGIDLYMDLNEAIAKYPEHKDAILADNVVSSGQVFPPQTQGQIPTQYSGQFRRPMVRKVVWWLKNQPVSVELAVERGLVEQREVLDEEMAQTLPAASQSPSAGAEQSGVQHASSPYVGSDASTESSGVLSSTRDQRSHGGMVPAQPAADAAGNSGFSGAATIGMAGSPEGFSGPTRIAYVLPNGTEVTPDSPDWPTAIGQISIINNAVVEWTICPWSQIPLAHMRNTLVIGKPWGVGEPFYAKKIQDAISSITDAAVRHTEYNANSAMEMHDGLKSAMEAEYGRAFVDPSRIIGIPSNLWQDGKPLIRPILPPPFPESSLKIRAMLGEDFNEIAGRPDVLAGNTPTANASGELVAQLQSAAVEPLNFKAQEIVYCVEKIVSLMLEAILVYEDPAKVAEQISMPLPLFMVMRERAMHRPPNVQITISTGAGSVLERKRAQYVQWNQLVSPDDGLPLVDGKSTRDALGGDSSMIVRRAVQARREAMAAMPMQPGQQSGQDEKQNSQESSNGNNGNGRFH